MFGAHGDCHDEKRVVLLRLHVFFSPGGRIHFLAQANVVLRSVYSWQSVMTTTCNVMTLALRWRRPPPGGDVRERTAGVCAGCQDRSAFGWRSKSRGLLKYIKMFFLFNMETRDY